MRCLWTAAVSRETHSSFLAHWNNKFKHIFAVEPDPDNRAALLSRKDALGLADRITVIPCAVGDRTGRVSFSLTGTMASRINEAGAFSVECRKPDDISWEFNPTYIKMDIEAAEPQALRGAAKLLQKHHPILAICTFHRSEHLWQLPSLIQSI